MSDPSQIRTAAVDHDVEKVARILHNEFSRVNEPDALWDSHTDQQRKRWRRSAVAVLARVAALRWRTLPDDGDTTKPPFDGKPVLIAINTNWGDRVHRVIWTDAIHGHGIFGWAVEDRKFGPYPLRGYTTVAGWQPLPEAPS